jgi:transcription initiation factor TFIID subunit TAF12
MSTLISKYRKFKADLFGYVEVPFEIFKQLLSLKAKKEWAAEDVALVRWWSDKGADYALSVLCPRQYKQHFGSKSIPAPEIHREDLDRDMRSLVKNCQNAGWTRERFEEYRVYLRSSMTVQQLAEQDNERQKNQVLSGAAKRQEVGEASTEGVEHDAFAARYRNGSSAFRAVVDSYLFA